MQFSDQGPLWTSCQRVYNQWIIVSSSTIALIYLCAFSPSGAVLHTYYAPLLVLTVRAFLLCLDILVGVIYWSEIPL